jgi:hypothetical protein
MTDSAENLVTLKITERDREWIRDEQTRLRKAGLPEPTQAELFAAMRAAYESVPKTESPNNSVPPSEKTDAGTGTHSRSVLQTLNESRWVNALLCILRSRHGVAVEAITRNLLAFEELVTYAQGQSASNAKQDDTAATDDVSARTLADIHERLARYEQAHAAQSGNRKRLGGPRKRDGITKKETL